VGLRAAYALLFVTQVADLAIVPLLPTLAREHGLGPLETASLLSATVVVTMLVSVPAGLLVDRVGARALTVAAAAIVAVSSAGLALAGGFWSLLAARAVFGIAYGIVWTAGIALIAGSGRRSAALSGAMIVVGLAGFAGPSTAGYLAELAGTAAPFGLAAALGASVALLLARTPLPTPPPGPSPRPREALAAVRRERRALGAVLGLAALGVSSGSVNLLVPLRLDDAGLSPGAIGTAFSVSSLVGIGAALIFMRTPDRLLGLVLAGALTAAYGAIWLLPVASASVAAAVAFILVVGALRSPLSTVSYGVGQSGAAGAGVGTGAVIGLMNLAWGVAAMTAPLVAGAVAGAAGLRWAFALVALAILPLGAWMLLAGRADVLGRLEHASR